MKLLCFLIGHQFVIAKRARDTWWFCTRCEAYKRFGAIR